MTKVKTTVSRPSRTAKVLIPPLPKYFFHNGKMVLQRSIDSPSPGVSVTEPNQVQSLKEILVKRARGIHPTFFNGAYSEYDTEDIQKMDFIELRDYRERVAAHAQQLKDEYKALTNKMEQVRAKAMEDRLDALIKSQADRNPPTSNPNS